MSARKNVNQSRPRALADDGADDAAGAADERVTFVWRSSPLLRLTTSAAPVDMLTLSGGGAECAYGAGFLAGWSDSGSRPRSRPRWQPYRVPKLGLALGKLTGARPRF